MSISLILNDLYIKLQERARSLYPKEMRTISKNNIVYCTYYFFMFYIYAIYKALKSKLFTFTYLENPLVS